MVEHLSPSLPLSLICKLIQQMFSTIPTMASGIALVLNNNYLVSSNISKIMYTKWVPNTINKKMLHT